MSLYVSVFITIIIAIALVLVLFVKSKPKNWHTNVNKKLAALHLKAKTPDPATLKFLLIEYDKLLGYTLKNMNLRGETMGAKLKSAKGMFEKKIYNEVWEAHKLRNRMVHEVDFNTNLNEIKDAIMSLRKGIKAQIS